MGIELILIASGLVVSITTLILLTRYLKVHAFLSLLIASLIYGVISRQAFTAIIQSIQTGFGSLLAHIGILVVMGSIMGMMLEKTGAMEIISTSLLRVFDKRHSVLAVTVIGALVGIPVFCDSGFIILSRLIPSVALKAAVNPASLSLGLSSGLYTTHTLVPPTPGPLAAAANLGATDFIGYVMLLGMLVSIPVVLVSVLLAKKFGSKISSSVEEIEAPKQIEFASWKAFLPLFLPILLIASASIIKMSGQKGVVFTILETLGIPIVALSIGVLAALPLIERKNKTHLPLWVSEAVKEAGIILLITGAGGAFGAVIKSSSIDVVLKAYITGSSTYGVAFLVLAFVLTSILKTAQGSTTSAILISSSLLAPLAFTAGLKSPADISLLIIVIGGGAMTVSHVNDSYFWVVSQYGKISSGDALKTYTLLTLFQGLTVLIVSIILFLVLR